MDKLVQEMGKRISARRKELRLTQEELAEKAGLTSQTISTVETGTKALRPENIARLCEALDTSADYLLFGKISDMHQQGPSFCNRPHRSGSFQEYHMG